MRVESGASNDDDFQTMLRLASPLHMSEYVRAPVLFVHGAEDTLLPLEESERMAERVRASGGTTELLVEPDGGRLFNFREREPATHAWQATLAWLDRHLRPTPQAGG
jgi:dipeptidyl aminopeptidase/acylaminoacyl peptidase